jgi:hypothetical protein
MVLTLLLIYFHHGEKPLSANVIGGEMQWFDFDLRKFSVNSSHGAKGIRPERERSTRQVAARDGEGGLT